MFVIVRLRWQEERERGKYLHFMASWYSSSLRSSLNELINQVEGRLDKERERLDLTVYEKE